MTSGASHATVSLRPPRMGALSNRFEVSATSRFTNSAVVSLVLISQQLPFFIHIFVDICEASASQVFTASTNKTVSYFRIAKKVKNTQVNTEKTCTEVLKLCSDGQHSNVAKNVSLDTVNFVFHE